MRRRRGRAALDRALREGLHITIGMQDRDEAGALVTSSKRGATEVHNVPLENQVENELNWNTASEASILSTNIIGAT